MRFLLLFAFLLLPLMPAHASETQQQLVQDLGRACPHGYMVVNGKCTPPCPAGQSRTFSGRCQPIACPMGQEIAGNGTCMAKCPKGKLRDHSGVCVAAGKENAVPVAAPEPEPQPAASECPEGKEFAVGECRSLCLDNQERDTDGICVTKCAKGAPRVNGKCPGGEGLQFH